MGRPTDRDYQPELDGVRAVACLIVLFGHSLARNFHLPHGIGISRIGVWIFFVLSAFLLTRQLIRKPMTPLALLDYAAARFFRIVPLFVLAVLFYYFTDIGSIESASQLWKILTLREPFLHLWTIPPEMEFYVILPFVLLLYAAVARLWGTVAAMSLVCIVACSALVIWPPLATNSGSQNVGWYLFTFMCGALAAIARDKLPIFSGKTLQLFASTSIAAITGILLLNKAGVLFDPIYGLVNKHFLFGFLAAIVVYSVSARRIGWSRFFASNRSCGSAAPAIRFISFIGCSLSPS
jgi:peptidoglycan/LPS O-acetylase OafA/YrhL